MTELQKILENFKVKDNTKIHTYPNPAQTQKINTQAQKNGYGDITQTGGYNLMNNVQCTMNNVGNVQNTQNAQNAQNIQNAINNQTKKLCITNNQDSIIYNGRVYTCVTEKTPPYNLPQMPKEERIPDVEINVADYRDKLKIHNA
jgi:hypothetical protein